MRACGARSGSIREISVGRSWCYASCMNRKRFWDWGGGYPFAVAAVAAMTAACLPFHGQVDIRLLMLLYVPVVVSVASLSGMRPSAFCAVLSVVVLDVFFAKPYFGLSISDPAEWVALAVFLAVAFVTGGQTSRLAERERNLLRRQRELTLLNRLAFHMVSDKSAIIAAESIVMQVAALLEIERIAVYARAEDSGQENVGLLASAGIPPVDNEGALADWVARTGKAIGLPAPHDAPLEPRPVSVGIDEAIGGERANGVYLPLQTAECLEGVLFVRVGPPSDASDEDAGLLVAVANLAGAALERQRLESEAARLSVEHEADRLKGTIVSSVSHELKTPLAAAIVRVTALLEEDGSAMSGASLREELLAVSKDLIRLNTSIADLLDVSRLESDSWRPLLEIYEPAEVLGTVLEGLRPDQRVRVDFEIAHAVRSVRVDFMQLARALANIVENALMYSPEEEHVVVRVMSDEHQVLFEIEDHGPGIEDTEKEAVFEKFYRGSSAAGTPGTGLGLAIAREIAASQDGLVDIEDVLPTGTRFILRLPVVSDRGDA